MSNWKLSLRPNQPSRRNDATDAAMATKPKTAAKTTTKATAKPVAKTAATKKPVAKPTSKPVAKKTTAKAAPAKKAAAKPVAKTTQSAAKPVAKATASAATKKPVTKAIAPKSKAAPAKKAAPKPAAKPVAKKPAAKPATPVKAVKKAAPKPNTAKATSKTTAAKPTPAKTAPVKEAAAKTVNVEEPQVIAPATPAAIEASPAKGKGKTKAKDGKRLLGSTAVQQISPEERKARITALIKMGKERGYLTHAEINDHLPDTVMEAEQVEAMITTFNDLGIQVYDEAPAAEDMLMTDAAAPVADDEVVEEQAEQALATVDSEFGRTTDPVRMYMREMGTVELLTREGEIAIAKRIEGGLRDMVQAISACPPVVIDIIEMAKKVATDEMKIDELVDGLVDVEAEEQMLAAANAASDEDTGDVGIGRGNTAGEAGDDDVGAVAGGDDEAAFLDVVEEVADLHRRHQVIAHQVEHARLAIEHLGTEPTLDVVDGRIAQGLVLRDDVERKVAAELLTALGIGGGVAQEGLRGAVDDTTGEIQSLLLQGVDGDGGVGADLLGGLVAAGGDDQHRGAEIGGDVGVEIEFKARVLATEVSALAEHEIVLGFELFVFLEDVFVKNFFLAGGDQLARLAQGVGVGVGVLDIELEVFEHQVEIVVDPAKDMIVDDRAKKGDTANLFENHLHDAEDDRRFAASLFRCGNVQIVCHEREPPAPVNIGQADGRKNGLAPVGAARLRAGTGVFTCG